MIKTAKAKIDNATNNIEILFEKIANSGVINEIKNRITEHIPFNDNEAKEISDTYNQLQWKEKPEFLPFCIAMKWFNAKKSNLKNQKYLTIVDFSKKENEKRLYVINLETKSVEHITQCWIWKWSNGNESGFGNTNGSNKTSLWFYETKDMLRDNTRNTRGWIWLFIIWIEKSNDLAVRRWIAIHPVITLRNRSWVSTSEWCLTIPKYTTPKTEIEEILNSIKWDSLVFAYYPSLSYLQQSKLLNPHNK